MAQITIIGLGLVGNSIGLALRRYSQSAEGKSNPFTVVGYDTTLDKQQEAMRKIGSIDKTSWDLPSAVREASFVIIATPTMQVRETLVAIAPHLRERAIVSDTSNSKEIVLRWAKEILPDTVSFVGGHPLPSKAPPQQQMIIGNKVEETQPDADYFRGSAYCIIPLATATDAAVNQVISLAGLLGAQPYFVDPAEHDSFMAAVEHLPNLVAAAMMRLASQAPTARELSGLASGSFREVTRLAGADPHEARESLLANRDHLLRWIDAFQLELAEMRDLIEAAPADEAAGQKLEAQLEEARDARLDWLKPTAGHPEMEERAIGIAEAGQGRITRSLFGGLLGGGRNRDDDKKKR